MKRCVDCKWVHDMPSPYPECRAPANVRTDKIAERIGLKPDAQWRWKYCSSQRGERWLGARVVNTCGAEGRWWTPK